VKVLQFHNEYVFPGGEDAVAASEAAMLRLFGHDVIEYRRSNQELAAAGPFYRSWFYLQNIYFSNAVYSQVRALIKKERPDVAHFHNSFFMIGPAAYEACFDAGVPVIQSLHNYRFLCAAATFYRQGKICEECLSGKRRAGIVHGCWHGSRLSTWLLTQVIKEYEKKGILRRISRFIATSDFSCRKFLEAGWAIDRIVVKPNFLDKDPGGGVFQGKHVLYVGTLQPYKGVSTLLEAWASREWPVPLKIVGSGPMSAELRALGTRGVEWLGQRSQDEVISLMKDALCVVLPSECYENFPRVIIEAYACGVPVVASRLGAMAELVEEGKAGLLFGSGNSGELASALGRLVLRPALAADMGRSARRLFEERYMAGVNHEKLLAIYQQVA
jgi:glycosyltransferase involved in cell wall biosynthesis